MACSSGQIKFFRKNHIDLDRPNPILTVTDTVATNDGAAYLPLLRNRSNASGWNTTGSTDAAGTVLLFDTGDIQQVDMVMLVKHNFKSYLVEYYDEDLLTYQTLASVTANAETTTIHIADVLTSKIRITVNSTVIVDDDKGMRQLIITENIGSGQFEGFPLISKPKTSFNKKISSVLSGRRRIVKTRGAFSVSLRVNFLVIDNDLSMIETIYYSNEGILMLLSGGNEDQFRTKRVGYRNEDIVLVAPINELELPYVSGVYSNGVKIKMDLHEVVK